MSRFLRPGIRSMAGYVPGEQPRDSVPVKLNTNENPYPPSPRAIAAIQECCKGDILRKYPDPHGSKFRHRAGAVLGVDPDSILIGNGSDDILTILTRAFVPEGGLIVSPTPSYLLYRTMTEIQGARFETVPFTPDWKLPTNWPIQNANLTVVANPNSPSGTLLSLEELKQLAASLDGPLVIDEAYVDFATGNALSLIEREGVVVTRTLSKSYSLAGLRFGFGIAAPELIREFLKVKDSYNCDAISLACATAAIEDQAHMIENRRKILATRARLEQALPPLGFRVLPSQANFVWSQRDDGREKLIYEELKRRQVLVRYMVYTGFGEGIRITVGTDAEIDRLLDELRGIV